jgi:FecR-like protein
MNPTLCALLVAAALLSPSAAFAQSSRAGIVTALEGTATVTRVATPQPIALKAKDDVFLDDRVGTGEHSSARLLLGDKALVTVRELSTVTITEIPRTATINLGGGKIALAVVREKMRPGEAIEIRTPNAIAAVRGTVVIAEVSEIKAEAASSPRFVSRITVLHGAIEVTPLDEASRQPISPPVRVGALEEVRVGGSTPPRPNSITPESAAQIADDFRMRLAPRDGARAMPAPVMRAHWEEAQIDAARLVATEQGRGSNQKRPGGKPGGEVEASDQNDPAGAAAVNSGGNPAQGASSSSGVAAGLTVSSGNRPAIGGVAGGNGGPHGTVSAGRILGR